VSGEQTNIHTHTHHVHAYTHTHTHNVHTHTHAQDGLPPRERDGRGRRGPPLDRSVALLDWVGVGVCACMLVRACVRLWASVCEGVKLGGGLYL
jgi:hypothetical protein